MKNLITYSDEKLIELYLNGNSAAFSALVEKNQTKIFTSIVLLVKDQHLAEDIFQDVFIKVINTLKEGKYNEEGKFMPWVMRIAHNMCIDHFRRIKTKPVIKNSENYDLFDILSFSDDPADKNITKSQTINTVRKMIDMLPEDQREIVILRHYAELSFKEIATLTNCSINTALGRMRYGLQNLRKMMEENEIAL
jgi:RNA polymerase sigma factor (sigma-70 family)